MESNYNKPAVSPFLLGDSAPSTASEKGDVVDITDYIRIIKLNKFRILFFSLLFAAIGVIIGVKSTPIYASQVRLIAEPIESKVSNGSPWVSTALIWLFFETQKQLIESRNVALSVVDELKLVEYSENARINTEKDEVKLFDLNWRLWLPEEWRAKKKKPMTILQKRQAAANQLLASIDVKISKESQIILINATHPDPVMASKIANTVASSYRDFGLTARLTKTRAQTSFLNKQLKELQAKVTESEKILNDYQEREGLIDSGSRQQIVTAQLAGLSTQLVNAEAKRNEAEIRYNQVKRLPSNNSGYDSILAVLENSLISTLRSKQSELSQKVSELSGRYGSKHPKLISAKSELSEADRILRRAVRKVVGSLKQEYLVAAKQERKIRAMLSQREGDIQGLQSKSFELSKFERDAENARQVYEQFLGRFSELNVENDYDISNVTIIDAAEIADYPIRPRKTRLLIGGLFIGLIVGLFVSFLRDRLDSTFKVLEHAERSLDLVGLGIVPLLSRKDIQSCPERVVETSPHSPFSEAINHIRTGVLFSNIDHPPKVIMVTSSTASEGKTTFSSNLALSFSQMGSTLLLEVDLRKPRIAAFYGIEREGGVTDVAINPDRAQELIERIDPNKDLYVLPAGSMLPNPLEFLSSEAFSRLLEALRKKFDYVILDAPPVLPVSDAIVLSHVIDGVIVAVKADATTDKMAKEAVKRIRASHIQPIGVVLTQASAKRMAEYGGHYYTDQSYYGDSQATGYAYGTRNSADEDSSKAG